MYDDGSAFQFRYRIFLRELRAETFPNATTLATHSQCSPKTAQRAIDKFQEKFFLPIAFCSSRKGYQLTNPEFLSPAPPAADDELVTLLLMRNFARTVHSEELSAHLDSLWLQLTERLGCGVSHLETISSYFSAETTALQVLRSVKVLDLVNYSAAGEAVELQYRSPWKQAAKAFRGRILRVHLSDGAVYLLFRDYRNREFVLNAAFVLDLRTSTEPLPLPSVPSDLEGNADNWLQGFGIWAGAEIVKVRIGIRRPGADFFATQIWHREQNDEWQDDALIREMPSVVSPELVRRILSLGEHLGSIEPKALHDAVVTAATTLIRNATTTLPTS